MPTECAALLDYGCIWIGIIVWIVVGGRLLSPLYWVCLISLWCMWHLQKVVIDLSLGAYNLVAKWDKE